MKRLMSAGAALLMLAGAALADDGGAAKGGGKEIMADWRIECVQAAGCTLASEEVNGHRMQISRQLGRKAWEVVLSLPEVADAGAGLEYAVDGGAAQRIPPEFIEDRAGGRALAVRPEVTDVVVRDLKKGTKQARWRYRTKAGKEVRVDLPLAAFRPMLESMEKMLAEMGAMKQMGK